MILQTGALFIDCDHLKHDVDKAIETMKEWFPDGDDSKDMKPEVHARLKAKVKRAIDLSGIWAKMYHVSSEEYQTYATFTRRDGKLVLLTAREAFFEAFICDSYDDYNNYDE